jgi:myo-inositol-1(or 4)-monophosphatase
MRESKRPHWVYPVVNKIEETRHQVLQLSTGPITPRKRSALYPSTHPPRASEAPWSPIHPITQSPNHQILHSPIHPFTHHPIMLDKLVPIIREAGAMSLAYFNGEVDLEIDFKNPRDLVSTADQAVEDFLKQSLSEAFPNCGFEGEETGVTKGAADHGTFIVDPIDGTVNFCHNYPFYSVSVAYRVAGRTEIGLVYCPPMDDLFCAQRDQGATLNDKPIRVSTTDELEHAVLATGFSCVRFNVKPDTIPIFTRMVYQARDIHRDGSAALDLCYVGCGRCDLFWEMNLNAWDIAAGVLICQEAGGLVTDFSGGEGFEENRQIIASNGAIHDVFLRETADLAPVQK